MSELLAVLLQTVVTFHIITSSNTIFHYSLFNTTTILQPFFRDHLGEPVPKENFWTLWCKERLTGADTPTIRAPLQPD